MADTPYNCGQIKSSYFEANRDYSEKKAECKCSEKSIPITAEKCCQFFPFEKREVKL